MPTKLTQLIDDLAVDLREAVAQIESSTPVTRGHYGEYLSLLVTMPQGSRNIVGLALVRAGANKRGVVDALRLV